MYSDTLIEPKGYILLNIYLAWGWDGNLGKSALVSYLLRGMFNFVDFPYIIKELNDIMYSLSYFCSLQEI